MDVATLKRKVKRQFGDEYNILIYDQDILDWTNEAQTTIARETTCMDASVTAAANAFPLQLEDNLLVRRLIYKNRPLEFISTEELDTYFTNQNQTGEPSAYYIEGPYVKLWPVGTTADAVTVTYTKKPPDLILVAPYLTFPGAITEIAAVADVPELNVNSFTFDAELSLGTWSGQDQIISSKSAVSAPTVNNGSFSCFVHSSGTMGINFSDGATSRVIQSTVSIASVLGSLNNNQILNLRWQYNATTARCNFYYSADNRLSWLPIGTVGTGSGSAPYNLYFANIQPFSLGRPAVTSLPAPTRGKFYYARLASGVTSGGTTVFEFDASVDTVVPGIPYTPITTTSGHTMSLTSRLLEGGANTLSLPIAYHEDIVKFALARAHEKNQNFRAAENQQKEFASSLAQRRHEATVGDDSPMYKMQDPFDYEENLWGWQ